MLADHAAPGRGGALALRFMAAVHRLVLSGRAGALAAQYPSAGGVVDLDAVWPAFAQTLRRHRDLLVGLVGQPCQTNEVGRSAGLAVGFVTVARRTGLPLRLREVGASAGLNLRVDHFRIGGGGVAIGDPHSPVDLSGHWRVPPPVGDIGALPVVDRRGCDRAPVDATSDDGRLRLMSSVWADQVDRFARLRGAIALARAVPAVVDAEELAPWIETQLVTLSSGQATVVYHSVVLEYLSAAHRERFVAAVAAAGERATPDRPLAWVRLEPISAIRQHGIELTMWPGGQREVLARCGAHGTDVEWLAGAGPGA